MGKHKQRFNKKQAVRFTLVPGFDQNGKPITHFRAVQIKKGRTNAIQRQKLIKQLSDEVYDEIQINGQLVCEDQIPAFVLEQIRGRKDLVFNQKMMEREMSNRGEQEGGDLYDVIDANDVEDEEIGEEGFEEEWIDEDEIIDQDDGEYTDQERQWSDQEQMEEIDGDDMQEKNGKKQFKLKQEDFPVLNKINIQGKDYQLTQEQIKLLDVLIPENYQKFQIKGLKFQKYDQSGLPLSQKLKYQEFLATGKQGIVDSFDYVPPTPTPIFDTDLKPSQITGEMREIQDALNFQGQEEAYAQLQDDFFAKLIQSQITSSKKQPKKSANKKAATSTNKTSKPQVFEIKKQKPQKIQQQKQSNLQIKQNIFSKYDQLDEDILQNQITDQMLDKALDDFQNNIQTEGDKKFLKNRINYEIQEQEQRAPRTNASMNFSEIQKCEQLFGKDGQLDWRCLSKKQKREYMKTKIIRDYYDEMKERQIEEKIKGKKNITAQQLHLKSTVKHLSYQQDHVMRKALEDDAKVVIDLEEDSSYQSSGEQEDIVEYHQRTSVISTNLNEISEPAKKKKKKKQDNSQEISRQLDELNDTLSKLKASKQKRNRNQTKQQRKQRKQKQKNLKKQKKQLKKQFIQKFNQQRKKHIKMTKPVDSLHKISYVKII